MADSKIGPRANELLKQNQHFRAIGDVFNLGDTLDQPSVCDYV